MRSKDLEIPRYLYHATVQHFKGQIKTYGLKPGGIVQMFGWCDKRYVYLSNDPNFAKSFIDPSIVELDYDTYGFIFDDGDLLLTISTASLDPKKLSIDHNVNMIGESDEKSYRYKGVIPPTAIKKYDWFSI